MQEYFEALVKLTEASAERDFGSIRAAIKIARRFINWLKQHNEQTPIVELLPIHTVHGQEFCVIPVSDLGLPYKDLDIGVMFSDRTTLNGVMHMFVDPDTNKFRYVVLFNVGAGAKHELDLAWRISEDVLVHEIVHYFDRKRQKTRARQPYGVAKFKETGDEMYDYANNPLEMNSHFLQGLYTAFRAAASDRSFVRPYLENFDAFYRWAKIDFKEGWFGSLSPKNRRKVLSRLHKAFEALKASEDPKTAMYHIINPQDDR